MLTFDGCSTVPLTSGLPNSAQSGLTTGRCDYNISTGAVLGGLAGALLGALVAGKNNRGTGALIGGVAGAALGAGYTQYLQNRCEALRVVQAQMHATQLAYQKVSVPDSAFAPTEQPQNHDNSGVAVTAINPSMFSVGSADLSASGASDMPRLAAVFARTDRRILIIGHTDSTGDPKSNIKLSERRAETVARLFEHDGIAASRLYYAGAGDTEPVDNNATEAGRAHNRRVEVVELGSEDSILAYNAIAQSNPEFMQRRIANRAAQSSAPTAIARTRSHPKVRSSKAKRDVAVVTSAPAQHVIPALRRGERFDLGGAPALPAEVNLAAYVGNQEQPPSSGILDSLIPSAWAQSKTDLPLLTTSCIADQETRPVMVKSLESGRSVLRPIGEHVQGLYGSSWTKLLNGNLIAVTEVAVLSSGGQVEIPPHVLVFQNFHPGDQKPSLRTMGFARAYLGDKGVLYRIVLPQDGWPLRCIDFVFSRKEMNKVAYGRLYYDKLGAVYAVNIVADPVH